MKKLIYCSFTFVVFYFRVCQISPEDHSHVWKIFNPKKLSKMDNYYKKQQVFSLCPSIVLEVLLIQVLLIHEIRVRLVKQ